MNRRASLQGSKAEPSGLPVAHFLLNVPRPSVCLWGDGGGVHQHGGDSAQLLDPTHRLLRQLRAHAGTTYRLTTYRPVLPAIAHPVDLVNSSCVSLWCQANCGAYELCFYEADTGLFIPAASKLKVRQRPVAKHARGT